MNISNYRIYRQRGFSLVELMVAVVIGLIGTVVMFQVFAISEGQKRSTTSGNDAQQNGAIALFSLERDLRNTAHGVRPLINLGRPLYTWSDVNTAVLAPTVFRPTLITPGINSDSIDVTYSTAEALSVPIALTTAWNSATAPIPDVSVVSTEGIQLGDHIAICPNLAHDPTWVCVRGEVTGLAPSPAGGPPGFAISLDPASIPYTVNNTLITPRFNPAAGYGADVKAAINADSLVLPASYPGDGDPTNSSSVINLGQLVTRTYAVQNGQLTLNDGATTTEFANSIVGMRAQYGLDLNNDGSVDAWVDPRTAQANPRASYTPFHALFLTGNDVQIATSWGMVKAIRVAIVARGDNMEKEVVETRSTIPLWTNVNGNPAPSYTVPTGDGSHYRYRVFETIVPFRNMIW